MRQVEGQPGRGFNANRSLWVRNEPVGKLLPTPSNSKVSEVRAFAFLFFPLFMVPAPQGVLVGPWKLPWHYLSLEMGLSECRGQMTAPPSSSSRILAGWLRSLMRGGWLNKTVCGRQFCPRSTQSISQPAVLDMTECSGQPGHTVSQTTQGHAPD